MKNYNKATSFFRLLVDSWNSGWLLWPALGLGYWTPLPRVIA